jgi:peptidoglycan L-alanyl-D-glutamate endopeptidase CwlK
MSRNVSDLHPRLQTLVEKLKSECEKQGLKIEIGECLRTVEEQDALYAKGRTASGSIVTNAKGSSYSSMHQWGIAFDFYRNDGKGAYYNNDNFFSKVGAIGKKLGLEWGGDWKSITDLPHFQLPDWGSTAAKLKATYSTPDKFKATWSKTSNKSDNKKNTEAYKTPEPTLKLNSSGTQVKYLQIALNKLVKAGLTTDGKFGEKTKKALTKWQSASALTADGIYGKLSQATMKKQLSKL